MKIEDFDEFSEMNDNNEKKLKFYIHKPKKSLITLNENILKNLNSDIDSDTTDENSPIHKDNKIIKFNFKKKKKVKFSKIEIIRVESYKKYNKNNEFKYNNNNKQFNNEKCVIF